MNKSCFNFEREKNKNSSIHNIIYNTNSRIANYFMKISISYWNTKVTLSDKLKIVLYNFNVSMLIERKKNYNLKY